MRLLTFARGDAVHVGAVKGDGVVDATARFGIRSVLQVFRQGELLPLGEDVARADADLALDEVDWRLPIPDPGTILCVGVNYQDRNAEYRDNSDAPKYPSLFVRSPRSFSAHGQDILIPGESEQLDYEGEIVVVIGKAGRRIAQSAAREHIGGLTIMNEGTIRDWVRHGKFNVTPGKNWFRSGGLGPWIETDLTEIDLEDLSVETRVNDEVRQKDTTASMAFPIARIVEYVSTFMPLEPGDMIATGTPTGAGGRFDPPKWLKAGDRVEVSVQGVGTLVNTVACEDG